MALLKTIKAYPVNCTFSRMFCHCFRDASDQIIMKSGYVSLTSNSTKLSSQTYCSLTSTRNIPSFKSHISKQKHNFQHILRSVSTEGKAPDAFTKFSAEIDIDTLRETRVKELRLKGKDVSIHQIVKDIIKEKCDEAFANLNAEDQRRLKIVQLEHDVLYSQGYNIMPAGEMTSENWLDAMNMTANQRRRYFFFLQNLKRLKKKEKDDKALKSAMQEKHPPKPSPEKSEQKSQENRIFLRLYDSAIKKWQNHVLSSTMQHGIPFVWDMDYGDYMNAREIRNTAKQLLDAYFLNRSDEKLPFHLHFVNCTDDNPVFRYMHMYMQNDPHFMATVTPKSCLEMFDKKDIVYLSPHSPVVMNEFNPNSVYVLGAFNDKAYQRPISFARAKELGVKCMQLPLDKHVQWKMGSKALTLNQMMMIFQGIKNKKSWHEALTAIPTRKIIRETD